MVPCEEIRFEGERFFFLASRLSLFHSFSSFIFPSPLTRAVVGLPMGEEKERERKGETDRQRERMTQKRRPEELKMEREERKREKRPRNSKEGEGGRTCEPRRGKSEIGIRNSERTNHAWPELRYTHRVVGRQETGRREAGVEEGGWDGGTSRCG